MIEVFFALAVILIAGAGLGLGLAFGRGPAKNSCGAAACLPEGRCADCPLRKAARAQEDTT